MPGFQCQACNVSLNSLEQLEQHRTGRKHLNKLKEKGIGIKIESDNSSIPKLYGTFVASSEQKNSQKSEPPLTLNVNEFEDKPLFPPPPPPPPINLLPVGSSGPVSRPARLSNGQPMPKPMPVGQIQQPDKSEQITLPAGMNPVMKAVVNNALGNLPLKRKAYNGRCDACNVLFTDPCQEQQHYSGKRHGKKLRVMAIEEKLGDKTTPVLQSKGFSCLFCNVVLNSLEQLEQHRSGSGHQKKIAAATRKPTEQKSELQKKDLDDRDLCGNIVS